MAKGETPEEVDIKASVEVETLVILAVVVVIKGHQSIDGLD